MNSLFDENLISFVREALELVQTAITYDEASNYVRACEYYDNTVLLLDEALNKLDPSGREYDTILQLRLKYATRLELLRAHETSKRDLNLLGGGTPITKIPGQGTSRQRRMSRQPFDEEMSPVPHHQEPSSSSISLIRQPYNVLRIVRSTIETGAFLPCQSNSVRNLHGRIYIPSIVWKQFGVKLSGLSAKTSAFESLVELIETRLENLCYPDGDLESLMVVKEQFQHFIAAIQALQNSLSKPFPFISEIDVTVPASVADSEKNGSGSSSGPGSGFIGSGSSSSGSGLGLGSSPPTSSAGKDGKGQGWGTFVAGYAKTVVKYAEVGYHRMGAMSARVSDDDFAAYATLILILCEKCQVGSLIVWLLFLCQDSKLLSKVNCKLGIKVLNGYLTCTVLHPFYIIIAAGPMA